MRSISHREVTLTFTTAKPVRAGTNASGDVDPFGLTFQARSIRQLHHARKDRIEQEGTGSQYLNPQFPHRVLIPLLHLRQAQVLVNL